MFLKDFYLICVSEMCSIQSIHMIDDTTEVTISFTNIVDKMREFNPGQILETDTFCVNSFPLKILVYPNGSSEDTKKNISVLVKNESDACLTIDEFQAQMLNKVQSLRKWNLSGNGRPRGFHKFLRHECESLGNMLRKKDDLKIGKHSRNRFDNYFHSKRKHIHSDLF